jgi:putative transposase
LVFVTKYRRDALSALAIGDLSRIYAKVCRDFEAKLIECDGEDDHVHLLIIYPPKVALSKLVNRLKGVSSRLLREGDLRFGADTRTAFSGRRLTSSRPVAARPLAIIADYVKSQREPPTGRYRLPPRPKGRGFSRGN